METSISTSLASFSPSHLFPPCMCTWERKVYESSIIHISILSFLSLSEQTCSIVVLILNTKHMLVIFITNLKNACNALNFLH